MRVVGVTLLGAFLLAPLACGSPGGTAPPPDAALAPEDAVGFLLGSWRAGDDGPQEHWHAVRGAAYGITLFAGGFEVMIVDEDPPKAGGSPQHLTMLAMPSGRAPVRFRATRLDPMLARFENPEHDDPTWIQYDAPTLGTRRAQVGAPGRDPIVIDLAPFDAARAPELEAADGTFDADTARDGGPGWARHFDPKGAMLAAGDRRIEGREAIEAHMTGALEEHALHWEPRTSGVRGDLGFTVGEYTLTRRSDDAVVDRGSYASIWRRQPDGSWAVLFDAGRPEG